MRSAGVQLAETVLLTWDPDSLLWLVVVFPTHASKEKQASLHSCFDLPLASKGLTDGPKANQFVPAVRKRNESNVALKSWYSGV